MLSQSQLEEITIWEDYLIYAIIFNDTSKLNEETKDFYERLEKTMNTNMAKQVL